MVSTESRGERQPGLETTSRGVSTHTDEDYHLVIIIIIIIIIFICS